MQNRPGRAGLGAPPGRVGVPPAAGVCQPLRRLRGNTGTSTLMQATVPPLPGHAVWVCDARPLP